jgi:hypothetical protein
MVLAAILFFTIRKLDKFVQFSNGRNKMAASTILYKKKNFVYNKMV